MAVPHLKNKTQQTTEKPCGTCHLWHQKQPASLCLVRPGLPQTWDPHFAHAVLRSRGSEGRMLCRASALHPSIRVSGSEEDSVCGDKHTSLVPWTENHPASVLPRGRGITKGRGEQAEGPACLGLPSDKELTCEEEPGGWCGRSAKSKRGQDVGARGGWRQACGAIPGPGTSARVRQKLGEGFNL